MLLMLSFLYSKDYTTNPEAVALMDTLVKKYGFNAEKLETLFSDVKIQKTALKVFLPKEKEKTKTTSATSDKSKKTSRYGSWERYTRLKFDEERIGKGIAFVKKYQALFEKVEKQFGVPKEYLAAIIGVESKYGEKRGVYPTFDTLATLAFEKNRRNGFFKRELMKFMHLTKSQKIDPKDIYGSYAGAIGLGQFMPSNYEAYGVDFNGDGRITLQQAPDAIASVANYLKKSGWREGEPVAARVSYEGTRFNAYEAGYEHKYEQNELKGIMLKEHWNYKGKVTLVKLEKQDHDELWFGAKNFYVITRYNHSSYYAMTVHLLAQAIKKGMQ